LILDFLKPSRLIYCSNTILREDKMRYMSNKKGQGFDTFKLLIAAVVAMVILGIVTGVFARIWDMIGGITCVSQPIGEITSTVQAALAGVTTSTQVVCLRNAGDSFALEAINAQLSGAEVTSIECSSNDQENQICSGAAAKLTVTADRIEATGSAQFKIRVCCGAACGSGLGPAQCKLTVINA